MEFEVKGGLCLLQYYPKNAVTPVFCVSRAGSLLPQNFNGGPEKLSMELDKIRTGARTGDDIRLHISKANTLVETVLMFLGGSLELQDLRPAKGPTQLQRMFKTGRNAVVGAAAGIGTGCAGALGSGAAATISPVFATLLMANPIAFSVVCMGVAGVGATAAVQRLAGAVVPEPVPQSENHTTKIEYLEFLELATEEASRWSGSVGPVVLAPNDMDNTVDAYELALVMQVEVSNRDFKEMIQHSSCDKPNCTNPSHSRKVQSEKFDHFSPQSVNNLLRRIKIVRDTYFLYKEVVKDTKYVVIVGVEDVGKSTFIKEMISRFGPPHAPVPADSEIGLKQHTKQMKSYQVTKELCLVDFPGGNGTGGPYADQWKDFTMLPSSAILFLDFKNDLKKEQLEMYNVVKESLETSVTVVFNKVDQSFTPSYDRVYTFEYFEKMRDDIAIQLGCCKGDIYYMSVRPDFENPERLQKLHSVGVVDVETFADLVFRLKDKKTWNVARGRTSTASLLCGF